jgi:hypothetical protein
MIASPNQSKKPGKIKSWAWFLVDKLAELCGTIHNEEFKINQRPFK